MRHTTYHGYGTANQSRNERYNQDSRQRHTDRPESGYDYSATDSYRDEDRYDDNYRSRDERDYRTPNNDYNNRRSFDNNNRRWDNNSDYELNSRISNEPGNQEREYDTEHWFNRRRLGTRYSNDYEDRAGNRDYDQYEQDYRNRENDNWNNRNRSHAGNEYQPNERYRDQGRFQPSRDYNPNYNSGNRNRPWSNEENRRDRNIDQERSRQSNSYTTRSGRTGYGSRSQRNNENTNW